jgi:outer membrane receptor protein involved in Fe transport
VRVNYSRIDNDGIIDYINVYQLNDFREPLINVNGSCVDPRAASDTEVLLNVACFESVEDADTVVIDYAKVSLRGEPSDSFSYQLSYQYQDDEIGARRSTTLGDNNQPVGSDLYFAYGDDDSGQTLLEPSERDVGVASLDLEWDLGFATFTSSTSSFDHEGMGESDNGALWASGGEVDGTSRDWNTNYYGGQWPRPAQRADRGYDDEVFSQEFRLVSNESDGNLDWIVGAFYMDQDTNVWQLSHNPGMNLFKNACRIPTDPVTYEPVCVGGGFFDGFWPRVYSGDLTEIDFEYVRDTAYEETAIYGELTYHVSDTFRLTGGLRWFDNETVNDMILGFPLGPFNPSPAAPQSTDSDDDVLLKLNVSWDLNDDTMVYAVYSEGYRHGGAQSVPDSGPFAEVNALALRTFDSDSVKNYEIGIKGGRENLLYTASLFHVDWDDPQLNYTSNIGFYLAGNGDEASTEGIELELEGFLTDTLHYRAGYLNVIGPKGAALPAAPENTLSLNVDNRWEINADMDLVAALNAYFQDESENYISTESQFSESFDSFWLVGATASLVTENWSATLYAKNLTDEAAPTGGFPIGYWSYDTGNFENWYGNGNRQFIVQPRTIGLKFGYRF